jgi:2-oxoglutarate ferredoxin oxidoreductase subunit beta
VTGTLYLSPDFEDLHAHRNTVETPFNRLTEKDLCSGVGALDGINAVLR